MTVSFFSGRSTLHRLHQQVQRNILRNHQARYESTKQQPSSQQTHNASSTTTTSSTPPPPPPPQQRTIPGPTWAWIDPLMRPFRGYARMQKRSPLTTQLESTLVIYYLGDLSSQTISSNAFLDDQYEPIRGLRAMLIGSIASIPGYKWFLFLGNNFNYRSHLLSICTKVLINQTFFTPVFNTYFFGMQVLLSGGGWREAKERVKKAVPVSWRNSWKVWPVVTAFSFTFVPWQYRNVFAGVVAIGWQSYLSWLNRREEGKQVLEARQEVQGAKEKSKQKPRKKRRREERVEVEKT